MDANRTFSVEGNSKVESEPKHAIVAAAKLLGDLKLSRLERTSASGVGGFPAK